MEESQLLERVLFGDDFLGAVIAGQAGVGKSRLARELLGKAHRRGFISRWAVGTESARSVPLGALAGWCDQEGSNPLPFVHQLVENFARSESTVVVGVDDAHLLDEVSAFVLHQLVLRECASVLVTIRSGEPAPDAVTALWKEGYLQRLDLQALSKSESDELLAAALGGPVDENSALRMWRLTQGNALYLHHLAAQELREGRFRKLTSSWHWFDSPVVSDSLADLIEQQIGELSESIRRVVDTVAIAEPFPVQALLELAPESAIDEAEERGLIQLNINGRDTMARMAHPLYGEVRRARAGPLRLRRLRGQAVTALAATPERGLEDTVRRAVLRAESDLPIEPDLFRHAASGAMILLDMSLAERLAGLSCTGGGGFESIMVRAHALVLLHRGAEAEELLSAIPTERLDDIEFGRLLVLRAANLLWVLADPDRSDTLVTEVLQSGPTGARPSLWAFRTVQLAVAGKPLDALEAMRCFERDDPPPLAKMCGIWGTVIAAGDVGRSELVASAAEVGYRLAEASQEAAYHGVGLAEFHVTAMTLAGDLAGAQEVADRTYRLCLGIPGVSSAMGAAIAGMAALGRGDLVTAVQLLGQALGDFDALGYPVLCYRFGMLLAQAHAAAGQIPDARAASLVVERCRHPSFGFVEPDRLLSQAWILAGKGATSRAIAVSQEAARHASEHHQYAREVICLQTAIQFGDPTCSDRLMKLSNELSSPRAQASAAFAVALKARDGEALVKASRRFETLGDQIAAADAAAHAALVFSRANLAGSASTQVSRAQSLGHHCGGLSSPCLREIADLRVPLTRREREVVALVVQGHTNKEVAETLVMSVRTVEGHLYRAMMKTGAQDRRHLGAILRDFDAP